MRSDFIKLTHLDNPNAFQIKIDEIKSLCLNEDLLHCYDNPAR